MRQADAIPVEVMAYPWTYERSAFLFGPASSPGWSVVAVFEETAEAASR